MPCLQSKICAEFDLRPKVYCTRFILINGWYMISQDEKLERNKEDGILS